MDDVTARLDSAEQALERLRESLAVTDPDDMVRDSAILRFALAVETAWKAARAVLVAQGGGALFISGQPKAMVRESVAAGWLSEPQGETALRMINDRNLTVHTYDQERAAALFARLPGHADLLGVWLVALRGATGRS